MDRLQPQWASDFGLGGGQCQTSPVAPKPLTHDDRLNQLEAKVQQIYNELSAVADSHSGRISQLEAKVG